MAALSVKTSTPPGGETRADGKLVSPASLKVLWADRPPNNYGAGFEIADTVAGRAVGHTGFFTGVSSRLSIFPDTGYVVVVLSNIDNGAPELVDAIGDQIALAHGLPQQGQRTEDRSSHGIAVKRGPGRHLGPASKMNGP